MTPNLLKFALITSLIVVATGVVAWQLLDGTSSPTTEVGAIEGFTNYPSHYIPAQVVCAEPIEGGSEFCTEAPAGDVDLLTPSWKISVPVGTYYVSAHVKDSTEMGSDLGNYRAYYTAYVVCGLKYECKDHSKIPIKVEAGQSTTGIAPYDWYNR